MKFERMVSLFSVLVITGTFIFFANSSSHGVKRSFASDNASKNINMNTQINAILKDKKLVFSDEFNGTQLDTSKWATCYDWRRPSETGCTNQGNFEQEWYTHDQIKINNGNLILSAKKGNIDAAIQNQAKTFKYSSGMINSGRGDTDSSVRWTGTFGYYEARLKVPDGKGIWPAFWLLPISKEWPPEIDIMELVGNKPNEILQTVHWQRDGGAQKNESIIKNSINFTNGWHTYGIDWRTDGIDWYIDGEKTSSYNGTNIPHEPMEIILNLAIGGLLPGNIDASTPIYRDLQIDYVRVYQSVSQIRPHQY